MDSNSFLEKIEKDKRKQPFVLVGKLNGRWKCCLGQSDINKGLDKANDNELVVQGDASYSDKFQFKVEGELDAAKKVLKEVFESAKKPFDSHTVAISTGHGEQHKPEKEKEKGAEETPRPGSDRGVAGEGSNQPRISVSAKIKKEVAEVLQGNKEFVSEVTGLCRLFGAPLPSDTPPEIARAHTALMQKTIAHLQDAIRAMNASRAKIESLARRIT
jgi:hypothetical protein